MKGKNLALAVMLVVGASFFTGCGTNNANDKGNDIGEGKAKEIAIADSGVSQQNLSRLKVSKEHDDFRAVYDVEFADYVNGMEYDYEILASDGSIYSFETEKFDGISEEILHENGVQLKFSKEDASKLALDKVPGATAADLYIQLEREKDFYVYDGEIVYNQKEYDFEIDADSGEFLKWREKSM